MSFSFFLYRGPAALPPITKWEKNMADPIAQAAEVRDALSQLLPGVEWHRTANGRIHGSAFDPCYDGRYSLSVEEFDGVVMLIRTSNHASPATLARIMDHFNLNYCCTDFGDFRDPSHSDPDWKPIAGA